jgi:hypothetical protein
MSSCICLIDINNDEMNQMKVKAGEKASLIHNFIKQQERIEESEVLAYSGPHSRRILQSPAAETD